MSVHGGGGWQEVEAPFTAVELLLHAQQRDDREDRHHEALLLLSLLPWHPFFAGRRDRSLCLLLLAFVLANFLDRRSSHFMAVYLLLENRNATPSAAVVAVVDAVVLVVVVIPAFLRGKDTDQTIYNNEEMSMNEQ